MKVCPGCGRTMNDGEAVCPLCGAEAPEPSPAFPSEEGKVTGYDAPVEEPGEEKPKKKAGLWVASALAAVVVLGVAVWMAMGFFQTTDKAFLAEHQKLFRALAEEELAPLAKSLDAWAKPNVDMTVTTQIDESLGVGAKVLNDSAIRIQAAAEEGQTQINVDYALQGDTLANAVVTYRKDGTLGFCIPQLSENYYTMDYWQFMENNSDGQFTAADTPDISPEAWEKSMKAYGDILLDTVNKSNVKKQKEDFFSFRNQAMGFSGTAYVFQPTAEELEDMLVRLADALEADEALRAWFNASSNVYTYAYGGDPLGELVDTLRTDGGEMAREIAENGFFWTIRVGKGEYRENGRCCQVEISLDGGQNALRLERVTEGGYNDGIYFDVTADGEEAAKLIARHSGFDGQWFADLYVGDIWINAQQVIPEKSSALGLFYGSYNIYDQEKNTLLFCAGVEAGEDGGTDHMIRVDTDQEEGIISVTLHTTDKPVSLTAPTDPETDITGWTAEDFEALGEEWRKGISSIAMRIMMYAYQYE